MFFKQDSFKDFLTCMASPLRDFTSQQDVLSVKTGQTELSEPWVGLRSEMRNRTRHRRSLFSGHSGMNMGSKPDLDMVQ